MEWFVVLRISLLVLFLATSLHLTVTSLLLAVALLLSFYATPDYKDTTEIKRQNTQEATAEEVAAKLLDYVTYDAATESLQSLQEFRVITSNSQCKFARHAKLWGSADWKPGRSIELSIRATIPTFYKFCLEQNRGRLDGFVFRFDSILGVNEKVGKVVFIDMHIINYQTTYKYKN